MKLRNPTIVDVARASGLSTATVSRALNGGLVSSHAHARVMAAVADLGYRPNTLARGLATGRTGVIGVLIPDVVGPLYAQMAAGIEDVTEPLGMHFFMLTDNRSSELEAAAIGVLLERRVDGLILIGTSLDTEALEALLRGGPAVVLVEREGDATGFSTIGLDDGRGARAATGHLIAAGHERIAHVRGIRGAGRRRLEGYLAAMDEAGLEAGPVLEGDFSERAGVAAAEVLLARHPDVTAVFCSNDRVALGLMGHASARGVAIPDDLSVVGFDDLPFSAYLSPALTTVRQDARAMGCLAAERIVAAIGGDDGRVSRIVTTELVVRASVAGRASTTSEEEVTEATEPR